VEHQKEQANQSSNAKYDGNLSRALALAYLGSWQEKAGEK
jgi:hypothetical protein